MLEALRSLIKLLLNILVEIIIETFDWRLLVCLKSV